MLRRSRTRSRAVPALAMLALGTGLLVSVGGSSSADVTAVNGSAYGYSLTVSIFGSPPFVRPCTNPPTNTIGCGPTPAVTLPAGGSAAPVTDTDPTGGAAAGPAQFFSSGPITVSTQGTPEGGSVTSAADIQTLNTSDQEALTATSLASTCTASETDITGSTTVTGGVLAIDSGDDTPGNIHPPVFVDIPTNPAPNTPYEGHIHVNGTQDNFVYIFNEQVETANGITVTAAHQDLVGPTAVGDLYLGQVVCGVAVVPGTTSTTQPQGTTTSTTPQGTTTTTTPQGTTSTTQPQGTTTTTTPQDTTSTTQPQGTTTSTTTVLSGLDCETLTPAGGATAEANPTSVLAGNDTSVTGSGFEPGESLDLGLCSSPVSLGRVTADPSGNFSATVTVPAGTAAGARTIVVSSIDRLRIATVGLTVVAPGGGGGGGGGGGQAPLARTGADTARIVWLAGLALVTGAVLVRSARRTRRWHTRSR